MRDGWETAEWLPEAVQNSMARYEKILEALVDAALADSESSSQSAPAAISSAADTSYLVEATA